MGKVVVGLSISLDGFVAGVDDGPELPLGRGGEALFTWMNAGPESNRVNPWLAPPDASKPMVEEWFECGAIISGRRTFDIANGWKGGHGRLDGIDLSVAPVLLGGGVRLFDLLPEPVTLAQTRVVGSDGVAHLRYEVVR